MSDYERSSTVSLKITSIFVLLCSIIGAAIALNIHNVRILKDIKDRDIRLIELSGIIRYYDEVLTMSARMAVQTHDPKWKKRYEENVPLLENTIKESLKLMPKEYEYGGTKETDAANAVLVDMEKRAFALLEKGEREAAEKLLFSEEYEKQKTLYSKGIERATDSMKGFVERFVEKQRKMTMGMIAALGAVILLAVFLRYYILRKRALSIQKIAVGLSESAENVAAASERLARNNQSLMKGTGDQAAGIEETSSSLEEISSMTQQNAQNTREADRVMNESAQIYRKAEELTRELNCSMSKISRTSEETSKIIKSIDEISFQTNLLALNAAVEAARAGEAGAGFAVVADEVRNLALRSAEAAKNTSGLLEGTVKDIYEGVEIVAAVNETFTELGKNSGRMKDLISEISQASEDQARGIEQISRALSEIDKTTRQTAESAKEQSSASDEMEIRARELKTLVDEFVEVLGGKAKK